MAVKIQVIFWTMILCSDMVGYKHFGESCCLHLHFTPLHSEMATPWPVEMLVSCHITTWCHNPEDHDLNEMH